MTGRTRKRPQIHPLSDVPKDELLARQRFGGTRRITPSNDREHLIDIVKRHLRGRHRRLSDLFVDIVERIHRETHRRGQRYATETDAIQRMERAQDWRHAAPLWRQ